MKKDAKNSNLPFWREGFELTPAQLEIVRKSKTTRSLLISAFTKSLPASELKTLLSVNIKTMTMDQMIAFANAAHQPMLDVGELPGQPLESYVPANGNSESTPTIIFGIPGVYYVSDEVGDVGF
jgi:hypothetical protein